MLHGSHHRRLYKTRRWSCYGTTGFNRSPHCLDQKTQPDCFQSRENQPALERRKVIPGIEKNHRGSGATHNLQGISTSCFRLVVRKPTSFYRVN